MFNKYITEPKDQFSSAIDDFYRARNKAKMKEVIARLTGEPTDLLSYDEIRSHLKIQGQSTIGLKDIPVQSIVGSLGRYNDFTRDFLPRKDNTKERWARVKIAALSLMGLPPIEVYQIGETYFVKDGNHRVSVARHLGQKYIQAYVTKVLTRVSISPDDDPGDIILKAEYADFLEKTQLDILRPGTNLTLTLAGQYPILHEHISVHRYFMGIDQNRPIPFDEALLDWLDKIYQPIIQAIREQAILRNFPHRTETDLYIWIADHKATLQKELGWELGTDKAVRSFSIRFDRNAFVLLPKISKFFQKYFPVRKLTAGPAAGIWRKEILETRQENRLFRDVLVPIGPDDQSWYGFQQAILIAQREESTIQGLHIIPDDSTEDAKNFGNYIEEKFTKLCNEKHIAGKLAVAHGDIAAVICERARFADLVVSTLSYPPGPHAMDRLEFGFNEMIQRCPQPILATPLMTSKMERGLLAYDGSPKSKEALFIAAYMAERWKIPLFILSVNEGNRSTSNLLKEGVNYFHSRGIPVTGIKKNSPVANTIIETSIDYQCDFILMGGYGHSPIIEVMLGSTVNQVLQEASIPILICK